MLRNVRRMLVSFAVSTLRTVIPKVLHLLVNYHTDCVRKVLDLEEQIDKVTSDGNKVASLATMLEDFGAKLGANEEVDE